MGPFFIFMLMVFPLFIPGGCENRRPFYNIAHMVNSIEEIKPSLDLGANVIEMDIQFYVNGSINQVYHGFPCDFGRYCERHANLEDYLKFVRYITDPSTTPKNYANQLVMQYFDLKLNDNINLKKAGRDIARYVLDFLWSNDGKRKQEVRALIYFESISYKDAMVGFIKEFNSRGQEARLKDVGFDSGKGEFLKIKNMFDNLNIQNIWAGHGITNFLSFFFSDGKLREQLKLRDKDASFIKKVYHWTIDAKDRMRHSLKLGVDAIVTNVPQDLMEVFRDFKNIFRLATPDDNPFQRHEEK